MSEQIEKILPYFNVSNDFHPVVVGRICSAYGIFGWVKIVSFTETFDKIMSYCPWYIRFFSHWRCLYVDRWKQHQDDSRFIVKIKNVRNRDVATMLGNCKIFVDVIQFPVLDCGEYYWKDIFGCQVVGISGYLFGVVVNVIETGSNDVLVIGDRTHNNTVGQCFLIPFLSHVVKDVNYVSRVISVDWNPQF